MIPLLLNKCLGSEQFNSAQWARFFLFSGPQEKKTPPTLTRELTRVEVPTKFSLENKQ